ncbi:MAG: acyl-CoA thioesterase [Candidatus Neomarinimicrobiota bacterium]|nr:acyl-CoA thioesterase [Candidatus Neomarinimicrobiota bacterium]
MISIDHQVRVIYGHTDMMGRVYYGRYFEYFESARAHFLRELGLPYGEIEKSGIYIPVIESHCEYIQGATYDDLLKVRTMIRDVPKSRMKIEYDVLISGEETLVATGHTVHTFMNRRGSAVRPPRTLLALLNSQLNSHE